MRNVTGFLSDDGVFFDVQEDAELYEALHMLQLTVKNIGADPEKFMIVVDGCRKQLRRYLDAKSSYEESEKRGIGQASAEASGAAKATPNRANGGPSERHAPVFEQPADEREHVPDVRSGVSAEVVRDNSTVDGTGSGGIDARGVRGAAHLATTSPAALATSRTVHGEPPFRQAEAGAKLLRSGV